MNISYLKLSSVMIADLVNANFSDCPSILSNSAVSKLSLRHSVIDSLTVAGVIKHTVVWLLLACRLRSCTIDAVRRQA